MTKPDDGAIELDIQAFLNGQLDPQRALALAGHLAGNPRRAAQAMADMCLSAGLRSACGELRHPPSRDMIAAAQRLSSGLAARDRLRRSLPWVAAAALLVCGWLGHSVWHGVSGGEAAAGIAPLAETALDARAAHEIHRMLALDLPGGSPDARAAAARVGVALPDLPGSWHLLDVEIVGSPRGPAVMLRLDTPEMGEVMLYSVGDVDLGPDGPPHTFDYRGSSVAVFERGSSAFVLVDSSGAPADVAQGAALLARRFN